MSKNDTDFREEERIRDNKIRLHTFYTDFNELLFKIVLQYDGCFEGKRIDFSKSNFLEVLDVFFKLLVFSEGDHPTFIRVLDNYKCRIGLSDELYTLLLNTSKLMLATDIKMDEVDSSNVKSIGYDDVLKELYVQFHNGGKYVYFNVKKEEFNKLKNSSSVGSYLNSSIKSSKDYKRIG